MLESFFTYAEWVELQAFFSGYLLVYAIAWLLADKKPFSQLKIMSSLPLAYALVATLYWALQLKNWYPDYNLTHIFSTFQNPFLKIWGLLAILFWIPLFRRKAFFTVLHSLIFFSLLLIDLYKNSFGLNSDPSLHNNDLKIYSGSIILHLITLVIIVAVSRLIIRNRQTAVN